MGSQNSDNKKEPNYLTPLRGKAISKPVIGFDVETHSTKNKFVLGCISFPDSHLLSGNRRYDNPELMLNDLSHKRNYGHNIYATNLHFDAFTLFQAVAGDRLIPEGWEAFDNGSKLIWCKKILQERTENHQEMTLALLDSLNLFPLGVYDLGEILGKVSRTYSRNGENGKASYYNVGKLSSPSCMGKKSFARLTREEREELFIYCGADAEVTRKFMEWANNEIVALGAKPKITGASTSMDLFRRKHLQITIPQPEWTSLVEARFSYYGGRTEDYYKGNVGPAFEHDVTAMYPSEMESLQFPFPSQENFIREISPSESCLSGEGFAQVKLSIPDSHIPCIPSKKMDHLMFPTGTIEGVWTFPEIRHAINCGARPEKISWAYHTHKLFNPFAGYVRSLIDLRMKYLCPGCEVSDQTGIPCWQAGRKCANANPVEEVIKLFLNGLYGKFAQNFLTDAQAQEVKLTVKKGGGTFKPLSEASQQEIEHTMSNHPEYFAKGMVINAAVPSLKSFMNPILAAYVTAGARIKIHSLMSRGLREGAQIYYTDTDSIYSDKLLSFAIKGKILGELQHSATYDELIIIGPKAKLTREGIKTKVTYKGLPSKSWIVEDSETMRTRDVSPRKEIFAGMTRDSLSVPYTRFVKLKESMHRGLSPNEMVEITKTYAPFANPKRRILGKPSIKKLLTESFESKPWRINAKTQEIEA